MRRTLLASTALLTIAGGFVVATPAFAADTDIRINEVASTSALGAEDFVEVTNTGADAVDLSGWVVRDEDPTHAVTIPDGTVVEPGGFVVIEPNTLPDGFGLGRADAVNLFAADGATLIDSVSWDDHVESLGRMPDGTGEFGSTSPTPGAPNAVAAAATGVVINEIESNGDARGDWVELANLDTTLTADVSGWTIIDGDPTHDPIVLPEGTTIESGGYLGVVTDASFGLGGEDSVTLRDAGGEIVDAFAWTTHAPSTFGRCADMSGEFVETSEATFELPNACGVNEEPPVDAQPWPFGGDVRNAVAPGTWGEDMSGIDIAADGTVFAVNNDNAEIFSLAGGPETFTVAESWIPRYPDGSGQPDAEGISVVGDGSILLSTERDNTNSGVSRPSVLRVVLAEDGATTTTNEWNLTPITGALGANAGAEAIEWMSDADAVALGLRAADGSLYEPGAFGDHLGGVVMVAVEQTGNIHVLVLEENGAITELQVVAPSADVSVVMGLDWRAGGNELWALCDEACDNRASKYAFVDGVLTLQYAVFAPSSMPTAFTNEGIALAWCSSDPAAVPTTLWISDTPHDGVSLRVAAGDACGATTPAPTTPEASSTPDDDSTVAGGGAVAGSGQSGAGAAATAGSTLPQTGNDWPAWLVFAALVLCAAGALAVRQGMVRR